MCGRVSHIACADISGSENNFHFANSPAQLREMHPQLRDLLGYASSPDNDRMIATWTSGTTQQGQRSQQVPGIGVTYTGPPFATAYHGSPGDTDDLGKAARVRPRL
eukprot:COSAG01_NODE_1018_length_12100_cov_6.251562_9_plen_106_part_00